MKTDPGIQRRLLDLAEIDGELARINHKRKNLPELAEIEAAEKAVRASEDALVAVRTAATDLDREISRQEKEIDSVRAREERDRHFPARFSFCLPTPLSLWCHCGSRMSQAEANSPRRGMR